MSPRRTTMALLCAVSVAATTYACRGRAPEGVQTAEAKSLTGAIRDEALARARVWATPPVPTSTVDFSANTPGPGAFDAHADVDCTFVIEPVGGSTPKFVCTLPSGDHVKVKYGLPNGELPAEVAATRLLGALGFPTDRMNTVHSVRCRGCPLLPQQALQCLARSQPAVVCLQGASPDRVVTFEPAAIERPIAGHKIQAVDDQGWSWYELERIDPHLGGSSRAEVDALRLIAVLLAHWDNKGANQKLVCPKGQESPDGSCRTPIALIGDLGSTFGPKKIDLENWTHYPIWADPGTCRVSMKALPFGGATFADTQVSEAGRRFALTLLHAISREQLNTLFAASGVATFPHVLAEARQPQAWTDAFLDKVRQIDAGGPCPQ